MISVMDDVVNAVVEELLGGEAEERGYVAGDVLDLAVWRHHEQETVQGLNNNKITQFSSRQQQ